MAEFKRWVLKYTNKQGVTVNVDNYISMRVTKVIDGKTNSAEFIFNNRANQMTVDGELRYTYNDIFTIYDEDDNFIGKFFVKDYDLIPENKTVKYILGDYTYDLLNTIYGTGTVNDTSRNLIFNAVQNAVGDGSTQNKLAVQMDLTKSDGGAFETINYASVNKTTYEVIKELSQPNYTGDDKTYRFWIDENDVFHWEYPTDDVTGTLSYGYYPVLKMKGGKSEAENISSIIYIGGVDLEDKQIMNMYHNDDATSTNIKYYPYTDVGQYQRKLIKEQYSLTDTSNVQILTVMTNTDFINIVRNACDSKARVDIKTSNQGAWEANVDIEGAIYSIGDLYNVVDTFNGFASQPMRIERVVHNVSKDGWKTILTLKEDKN